MWLILSLSIFRGSTRLFKKASLSYIWIAYALLSELCWASQFIDLCKRYTWVQGKNCKSFVGPKQRKRKSSESGLKNCVRFSQDHGKRQSKKNVTDGQKHNTQLFLLCLFVKFELLFSFLFATELIRHCTLVRWIGFLDKIHLLVKVHLTPKYFLAQINLCTCLKRIAPFCPFLTQILAFYTL